ncbi:MAG: hypothetical protein ACE5ET_02415 [Gammaproteobacteria bacterium]
MYRAITYLILVMLAGILTACATDGRQSLRGAAQGADVAVLLQDPQRPYVAIANLEARGASDTPLAELLEDMRSQARKLGADAILPQERRFSTLGLDNNPWVGGYEKTPQGSVPVVYGYAIKFSNKL